MKRLALLILLTSFASLCFAQDLGIVWSRNDFTTHDSYLESVTAQPDGTYLASGRITINNIDYGYIIHFEESQETIKEYIIPMPITSSTQVGDPKAILKKAFFLDDGTIIAVGSIANETADIADRHPHGSVSYALIYGAWFVKVNAISGAIAINKLNRGMRYNDLSYNGLNRNSVIGYGADVWLDDPISNLQDIALLRVYDKDGNVLHDNQTLPSASRLKGNGLSRATLQSDGSILINNNTGVDIVSGTTYKIVNSYNPPAISCRPTTRPPGTGAWPRREYISPLNNGKFLLSLPLSYIPSQADRQYFGWALAKHNTIGVMENCAVIEAWDTEMIGVQAYDYIYPSPGSNTEYLGTHIDMTNTKHLLKYTDNGTFPNIEIGPAYPFNTRLSAPSSRDGFFSCGQDPITERAAIAKLSTCANFKIKDEDLPENNTIYMDHSTSINLSLPLSFEGAKAPDKSKILYDLDVYVESGTVNGITPSNNGGLLESLTDEAVYSLSGGKGKVVDLNRPYTIGETGVVIKYLLTIKDNYMTAGIPQSCEQTYIFYLRSVPKTDVVAMPLLKTSATGKKVIAAIKNIGQAPFSNYKITIYEGDISSSVKQTYTHNHTININETAHFAIDLNPSLGTTNLVLKFNDNGSGSQDQPELGTTQPLYKIE